MMTFISCAKTMTAKSKTIVPQTSLPDFQEEARANAMEMAQMGADEMARLLKVNSKLAAENVLRYQDFLSEEGTQLPALLAYTGMVFKRIAPQDFTKEDFIYAQEHLRITSFLYGLLRPLDLIRNYRLEGNVRLVRHNDQTMFQAWQPLLTDYFIKAIKQQGGTLLNLASGEMQDLFDWKRLKKEVRVISPEFITYANGQPKTIVVYAKMCRGEMTRYVLKNRIERVEDLYEFEWNGFKLNPNLGDENHPVFELNV